MNVSCLPIAALTGLGRVPTIGTHRWKPSCRFRNRRVATVSRYFFHVYSDTVALDDEGQELTSLSIAREAAVRAAREFAAEEITEGGQVSLRHRIEVEDENGRPLFTLPFSAAFRIIS